MPRIVKREPRVVARIQKAISDIRAGTPSHPDLKRMSANGTLRLTLTSVSTEARIGRHLIASPKSVYGAEHTAVAGLMPKKGSVTPLRRQLDKARAELRRCRERLARSRSYAFYLISQMHELEKANTQLIEERDGADADWDEPTVGAGSFTVMPPQPSKRSRRARPEAA